jgi:hypothetical protein
MRKTHNTCSSIEDLLVKSSLEILTEQESRLVHEHLQSCGRCQAYRRTVLEIQNAVQIPAQATLLPDPAIRLNLLQRMEARHSQRNGVLVSFVQTMLGLLRYRVPLYQAAIGVAMLFLIFPAVDAFVVSKQRTESAKSGSVRVERPINKDATVLLRSGLLDTLRTGRSIKEDSLLLKYIFTAI